MYDISIIIINYRTPGMLIDCLTSLITDIEEMNASIVVVDNASGDDSIPKIEKWLSLNNNNSTVKFICSENNLGFSGGNNLGIRTTESKYYLLLNSDTIVRSGSIQKLIEATSKNPEAGLTTPSLEWPDATRQISCFNNLSPVSEFISSAQTGLFTRLLSKYNVPIPMSNKITTPAWSSFACILIRKEVFDDIGLMDDGYFMYFEDAEFCYRAMHAGWKIINVPSARVVHLRGGSSPVKEYTKLKKRLPRYYYESRARYFYQLYGRCGLTLANTLWIIGRLISISRQLLGRSDKSVNEMQWLDIWTNWLNPLKKYTHPGDTESK